MTLVVDASVAIKFVVREHDTERARELLALPDPLIAPDWLLAEAASSFWKKVKKSELLAIHAERHLGLLPSFFQVLHPAAPLIDEAFRWSIRLRHSVYDCLYVALAVREDCRLATADVKLCAVMAQGGLGERVMQI